MYQSRFIYLISLELSGDITPEQQQELSKLVADDAELQEKCRAFREMKLQQERDKQPDVEAALLRVWEEIQSTKEVQKDLTFTKPPAKRLQPVRRTLVAAVVMVLFGTGLFYFLLKENSLQKDTTQVFLQKEKGSLQEKQNTKGIRSSIVLSDGTKICLNADSRVEYPAVFSADAREVYLTGEAFFEVTKNPERPFIIHLDNGTVRVLGTSFNIKAYSNSNVVETSVSTGRVAFIPKKRSLFTNSDTTFLTHDIKAVYKIETGEIQTLSTVSSDDKAWTEGKLVFKGLTFEEIATQLERTFGKKVVFADDDIRQYRLTGSFENNSLDEILYYLSISKPFTYRISDEDIVIGKVSVTN